MERRDFSDYKIDPLSLSAEENEQVTELIDENNSLLYEVPFSKLHDGHITFHGFFTIDPHHRNSNRH